MLLISRGYVSTSVLILEDAAVSIFTVQLYRKTACQIFTGTAHTWVPMVPGIKFEKFSLALTGHKNTVRIVVISHHHPRT